MNDKKIIAIDFDGTIVKHKFPDIGEPVPFAIEIIKKLQDAGHKLILYTMRSDEYLEEAVKYCKDNGITFWGVNENPDQHTWTNSNKVYAHIYIDDAALNCPLCVSDTYHSARPFVDWKEVEFLLKHELILY